MLPSIKSLESRIVMVGKEVKDVEVGLKLKIQELQNTLDQNKEQKVIMGGKIAQNTKKIELMQNQHEFKSDDEQENLKEDKKKSEAKIVVTKIMTLRN